MSVCVDYTSLLLKKAYKIPREEVEGRMEAYCLEMLEKRKKDINKLVKECRMVGEGENRVYYYLEKLKKEKNYFRAFKHLEDMAEFLHTERKVTRQDLEELANAERYINADMKIIGFSETSVKRILNEKVWGKKAEQKIDAMLEYLFLPELNKKRDLVGGIYRETTVFFAENRDCIERTPHKDEFHLLIGLKDSTQKECGQYVRSVFDLLKKVDLFLKQPSFEEEIKMIFGEKVRHACIHYDQVQRVMDEEIWSEVAPDIKKEMKLYEKIYGDNKEEALSSDYFICMGLYHIGHALMKRRKTDFGFGEVAKKLCNYGAARCSIMLHPSGTISAPCGLMGDHIFVGPGSIVESNCFLEENVVIAGCMNCEDDEETDDTVTVVGMDTTIKKGAMLVAGVKVGRGCIIAENIVLVKGKVEDQKLVEGEESIRDIWEMTDYIKRGGHSFGGT